jgi:hypothetical protein
MLILWLMGVGVSIVGGLSSGDEWFICDTLMFMMMDIMFRRDNIRLFVRECLRRC